MTNSRRKTVLASIVLLCLTLTTYADDDRGCMNFTIDTDVDDRLACLETEIVDNEATIAESYAILAEKLDADSLEKLEASKDAWLAYQESLCALEADVYAYDPKQAELTLAMCKSDRSYDYASMLFFLAGIHENK